MLLGPNGQNIYPEEIEDKVNNMPFVLESLAIQRDGAIISLVFPDRDALDAAGVKAEDIPAEMEKMRKEVNKQLASYEQIAQVEIRPEEFEKTPKNSIKRYLYK